MLRIAFLKTLGRNQASFDLVKNMLVDSNAIYLQTTRTCARWIRSEMSIEGVIGHSFYNGGDWEEVLINVNALDGISLTDLNAPLAKALDQWRDNGEPDKAIYTISL